MAVFSFVSVKDINCLTLSRCEDLSRFCKAQHGHKKIEFYLNETTLENNDLRNIK